MGISLYYSFTENQVYNNNLIENLHQAFVTYGCWGNVFNLEKPVGGNYWSDWTSPDADGDGFVDSPYVFTGGQDDLPWTRQDRWKTIPVDIDIKPGSHPNCFNVNGHGVIPVAILGSAEFDVTQIDVSTVSFAGLEVRVKGNDNPQCSVADVSGDFNSPEGAPDGWADLVCHFVDDPASWCPGDSTATLNGSLLDGRAFEGTDEICIVP